MFGLYNLPDKNYFHIAIPAALESIFMILLASADLIMVGTLGPAAIAAVSIFLQPRLVLLTVARSMASAVTLLTANKFGAGHKHEINKVMRQAAWVSFIVMGVLHIIFFLLLEQILVIMGAEEEYLALGMGYATISTFAVFITSMTLIFQAVQLGLGQTAVIMKTNLVGNVLNVICNFFLIFGIGPFPALGVRGAAVGTVIGATVTLALTLHVMSYGHFFHEGYVEKPDKAFWKEFFPVCSSVFSELGAERIGMVLFAKMAASLGTVPFAVHSICTNICEIYYDFALGLGKASMVLAGQSRGAKNAESWRIYRNTGIKWALVFSTVSFLITLIFKRELFGIYSSDPESLALSGVVMVIVALISYPEAHAIVTAGILRGSGQTKVVAIYSFVLITILRPLMTAFFLYYLDLGLFGAWLAMILDQSIRALCYSWRLKKLKIESTFEA